MNNIKKTLSKDCRFGYIETDDIDLITGIAIEYDVKNNKTYTNKIVFNGMREGWREEPYVPKYEPTLIENLDDPKYDGTIVPRQSISDSAYERMKTMKEQFTIVECNLTEVQMYQKLNKIREDWSTLHESIARSGIMYL